MKTEFKTRLGQTVVTHDEHLVLEPLARKGKPRRGSQSGADGVSSLIAALEHQQGLDCKERYSLVSSARPDRRSTASVAPVIEVPVEPGQLAMLLVESEGVFQWVQPVQQDQSDGARRGSARNLVFKLDAPDPATAPNRRGPLLDWALGELIEPVRIIVVRFIAREAVEFAAERLESTVEQGLVNMAGDAQTWKPGQAAADVSEPKRVLLFLHGTFSTSLGSFGALAATAAGKAFLEGARKHYDTILGYDHLTLSKTPKENAGDLLTELLKTGIVKATIVDVVAYSRGGLVARHLVEDILPAASWPFQIGKVAFVACTNSGTALASRENWKSLLDVYTNLAVAAGEGLGMLVPGLGGTAIVEGLKTLGAFAEAVVDTAITEGRVPGIAAMSPQGDVVKALNAVPSPRLPEGIQYFTVASDFRAIKFGERLGQRASLPDRLMHKVSDLLADALMGEANDLVVDNKAMVHFGGHGSRLGQTNRVAWGSNPVIHHLNYFQQSGVADALRGWLISNDGSWPLVVTDPLVINAETPVKNVPEELKGLDGDAVVVVKRTANLFYPRTASSILATIAKRKPNTSLLDALELREVDAAQKVGRIEGPPLSIAMTGWVRLVDDAVAEAILPPMAVEIEIAEVSTPNKRTTARRGPPAQMAGEPRSAQPSTGAEASASRSEPAPRKVECHFGAEMPPTIQLGESTTLTVTVSRDEIVARSGFATSLAKATTDSSKPIELYVQARANCKVIGTSVVKELELPERTDTYDFEVQGVAPGQAEIWVDARQGAKRLVRLVLQPTVIRTAALKAASVLDASETLLPTVEMRIYEESAGEAGKFKLHFVMQSRELGVSIDLTTHPLNDSRSGILTTFYNFLEGDWGDTDDEREIFMTNLISRGTFLYEELVPRQVRDALWKYRDRIGSIEVISSEPFIPWEMMFVAQPDEGADPTGKFLAELGLIRWLPNLGFPPASLALTKGGARHVIPEYDNGSYKLQHAGDERKLLKALFGSKSVDGGSRQVIELLRKGDFDLLHFGCHGQADPAAVWDAALMVGAKDTDRLSAINVGSLANLRSAGRTPIVFLNACQTGKTGRGIIGTAGMAESFVKRGAGLFVGTQWSIADSTALNFVDTFYRELKNGRSVVQATLKARTNSKEIGDPTWLAYMVYGHPYGRLEIS